jgi:hypothetical protein
MPEISLERPRPMQRARVLSQADVAFHQDQSASLESVVDAIRIGKILAPQPAVQMDEPT